MNDFRRAVAFVIQLEGGDKIITDSGGPTKWGISARAHPALDIASLTKEQAIAIYEKDYWQAAGCPLLPWPMSLCIFDAAVNQGVSYAVALAAESLDYVEALMRRVARYSQIAEANKSLRPYVRGWINRVVAVWREAQRA